MGHDGVDFDEEPSEEGFGGIVPAEEDEYVGDDDDDLDGSETEDAEDDD
jgi:hypothetical protein